MDSCVVDTRHLTHPFNSVTIPDSCVFKYFKIIVSTGESGTGFINGSFWGIFEGNKVINGYSGGKLWSSSMIVRNNIFEGQWWRGIDIMQFSGNHHPIVENNFFTSTSQPFTGACISVQVGLVTKVTVRNNIIFLNSDGDNGYSGGGSDSVWIYNNLIVSMPDYNDLRRGIVNSIVPTFCYNNFLIGYFSSYGLYAVDFNIIKNNVIINSPLGITIEPGNNPIIQYNNSWNNGTNYGGFTPDSTNLSVDPMIVNEDTTLGDLDFHLQMFSPLINAGDPNILDVDGSRSDIGLYGGPFGESYTYQDLAPKPPRNLSAVVDSEYISLSWNRNTEADFKGYNLFRDTTANFTADSTTLVSALTDTFYVQIIPGGIDAFYYKLTATDNQGNESETSEELAVVITSVTEYPTVVSDYRLYQNYPNPFNPSTKIAYKLKERGYVKLYVYDVKGELISLLVNQIQNAGYYEVEFSGDGQESINETLAQRLASGIYIYQIMIKSENNIPVFIDMKKMVLLK